MKNAMEEKLVISLFAQMLDAATCCRCDGLSLNVLYEEGECPHCADRNAKLIVL